MNPSFADPAAVLSSPRLIPDRSGPVSADYNDVYHSSAGALAQAEAVFLRGNSLPRRWHGRSHFTICETGFGLGVNFLATWAAWRRDARRTRRLSFVSIEAHPFARSQLQEWHRKLLPPDLQALASRLQAQWPCLTPGIHRLDFEHGAVSLYLALGTAQQLLPRLSLVADAIFLDGFAPARNPAMWSLPVLQALAERSQTGTTVATWAAAGQLRRDLTTAGFVVRKVAGFGGKRDMTIGHWGGGAAPVAEAALRRRRKPGRAIVVGAGMAGSAAAAGLAARGWQVTQLAPESLPGDWGGKCEADHAQHLAAALTPVADGQESSRARLLRAAALRAAAWWAPWRGEDEDRDALVRQPGTLQLISPKIARSEAAYENWLGALAALRLPRDWWQSMTQSEAQDQVGQVVARGGVYYPHGWLLRPEALARAWAERAGVQRRRATVTAVRPVPGGWQLQTTAPRAIWTAELVVLAAAGHTVDLLRDCPSVALADSVLPHLHTVAGQIAVVPARHLQPGPPRAIVAGDGYVLPQTGQWVVAGSTYDHDARFGLPAPIRPAGHQANLLRMGRLLPAMAGRESSLARDAWAWAGWRAVLPDRLPAIGWLAPGLGVAAGFGSRGMAWSVLAADFFGGDLAGEPSLLELDLRQQVSPWRVHRRKKTGYNDAEST